jgi:phosphoribosyl 1,2-cyclic phosphodiesterase
MNNFQFLVKLYGVRGSYPIAPENGTKYGGNTTCMLIRTTDHVVIIDAGSGLIKLGKELIPLILDYKKNNQSPFHITMLFTHTHSDHLLGLPFFAPIYLPGVHVHFIGPATLGMDIEQILRGLVWPQYFPVSMDEFRSNKSFHNINENMYFYFVPGDPRPHIGDVNQPETTTTSLSIHTMKYYFHPKDGSYPYRIEWNDKKIVLATDIECYVGGDQRLINFSKGADVLIHDAQYSLEQYKNFCGYGHSSYAMACDTAIQAEVKQLLLFHHDPNNSDEFLETMEAEARKIFPNTQLASEKWEFRL